MESVEKHFQDIIIGDNVIFLLENGLKTKCLKAFQTFENTLKFQNLHKMSNFWQINFFEACKFYARF